MIKKIVYIANIRLPTEKAHGIQIMETCEALVKEGVEVELVVPRRLNKITQDPFSYYQIKKTFGIRYILTIDLVRLGKIGFLIQLLTFVGFLSFYLLWRYWQNKEVLFYTRDEISALYLLTLGKRVVWEAHAGQKNWFARQIIRRQIPTVVITRGLSALYERMGLDSDKILIAPDGVNLGKFNLLISKKEARVRTSLPIEKKLVIYTGHLYKWKGADILACAAEYVDSDTVFVFVGGIGGDVDKFRDQYGHVSNIKILGQKSYKDIPLYLKAADVLVLPNSGKEDISRLYTSPMKLFEYMASKTPIIAAGLPSIKEVLNESNSYLFAPDEPLGLARVLKKVLSDRTESQKRAILAFNDVREYTWSNRAKKIIAFLSR